MTATGTQETRYTLCEWRAIIRGTRDQSYLDTRLGPSVQAALAWKKLGRTAARTLDQYERDLARLALALPDKTLDEVTEGDLMLLLSMLPEKSWRRFRAAWTVLFRWGILFDHITRNPLDRLPSIKPDPPVVHDIFTEAERAALVNGCAQSLVPELDRARMLVLLESGGRKTEMTGLMVQDIDLARRLILLRGKGRKERVVPLRGEVVRAIDVALLTPLPRLHRPLRPDERLWFPMRTTGDYGDRQAQVLAIDPGKQLVASGFHEWWRRRIQAADIRYRKPHMTRHTYATDLLDAEVNLYDIKDLLGHVSTATTERYIHSSRKRLNKAVELLAEFRGNDPNGA